MFNNPLRYTDPTGHDSGGNDDIGYESDEYNGQLYYKLWYFGQEMRIFSNNDTWELITNFKMYANNYKTAVSNAESAGIAAVGSGTALFASGVGLGFALCTALCSGGTLALPAIPAIAATGLATLGTGINFASNILRIRDAVSSIASSSKSAKDFWDLLIPFAYGSVYSRP